MLARAARLEHVINITGRITFSEDYDDIEAQQHPDTRRLEESMRNIYMVAKRALVYRREDIEMRRDWQHVLRFCEEAGMQSTPLRQAEGQEGKA